jgi:hypothetical protein
MADEKTRQSSRNLQSCASDLAPLLRAFSVAMVVVSPADSQVRVIKGAIEHVYGPGAQILDGRALREKNARRRTDARPKRARKVSCPSGVSTPAHAPMIAPSSMKVKPLRVRQSPAPITTDWSIEARFTGQAREERIT